MIRSLTLISVTLMALTSLGCGAKVKFEKEDEVGGEGKTYAADAPSENHKLKVEATSDQPVDVLIFMSSDYKKQETEAPDSTKALAKKVNATNISLDVTIPRKEEFTVVVASTTGKAAKFKLKMNSQ
jgi:hypothetical protein